MHPDNIIMYLFAFSITDGFSVKPFEMYSEIEMLSFYLPSLLFANIMTFLV